MGDVGEQVVAVLDALGLERVHLAGWGSADWGPVVEGYSGRVASLTLAFPAMRMGTPDEIGCPVLGFVSDQGNGPINDARLRARTTNAEIITFAGYNAALWNDVIADNAAAIEAALRDFLAKHPVANASLESGEGRVGEIRYAVRGEGPPLVVLPIGLVPSQWEAVTAALDSHFTVITLGGAPLGMVATLESRAESGYGKVVASLVEELSPAAGDRVLEVGCGPGSLVRALVSRHRFERAVEAVDINGYLMEEARALNAAAGLDDRINIGFGNAEALPFGDAEFDLLYCSTVLEEGHANKMLSEFRRVLRPGGRMAVAVRSMDMSWWVNVTGDDAMRTRLNEVAPRTSSGAGPDGCADASLYHRVLESGFEAVRMRPQLAVYARDSRCLEVRERLLSMLGDEEADRAAALIVAGERDGTFFVAEPFHGVIATR